MTQKKGQGKSDGLTALSALNYYLLTYLMTYSLTHSLHGAGYSL
jgi:hypothetical protein